MVWAALRVSPWTRSSARKLLTHPYSVVLYEESFEHSINGGYTLLNNTVVDVWLSQAELLKVINAGYRYDWISTTQSFFLVLLTAYSP